MVMYESKSDVPQNTKEYLETVSQEAFNDLDLHEINDFLYNLEDWINTKEKKD